jgi:hypothetical protein
MGNSQSVPPVLDVEEELPLNNGMDGMSEEPTPGATSSSSSSSSSVSSSSYVSAYDGGGSDSFYHHQRYDPSTRQAAISQSGTKDKNSDFCFPLLVPNMALFRRRSNPLRVIHCHDTTEDMPNCTATVEDGREGNVDNYDDDDDEGYYHFDDAIRKRGKSSDDCCSSPLPYYSTSSPLGFISVRSRPQTENNNLQQRQMGKDGPGGSDLFGNGRGLEGYDSDHEEDSSNCIYDSSSHRRRQRRPSSSSSSSHNSSKYNNSNNLNNQNSTPPSPYKGMFDRCYPSSGDSCHNRSKATATTLLMASPSSNALSFGSSCTSFSDPSSDPEWQYTVEELAMVDGDEPTEASNLQVPRSYWIVTTAALPWMTGTACNPLLRAAYLSQRNRHLVAEQRGQQQGEGKTTTATTQQDCTVTLVLPWLESPEDRGQLYGPAWAEPNKTPADQESFIRDWLARAAHLPLEARPPQEGGIAIEWYPARYHSALSSIFALGDLCELIPSNSSNDTICILEEPEHVNFYRAPGRESWRDKFRHVIGIVHTNYKAYARNHYSGILTGPLVGALSSLMVRAYCDKVVKLSPVLQEYAPGKEVVSNVHGIRQEFFRVPLSSSTPSVVQCYFIGKLLWGECRCFCGVNQRRYRFA